MSKRTFASVTEVECTCGYLERLASSADRPIRFNPELNEFSVEYECSAGNSGSLLIYHCPFCGGAAPESRRGEQFAQVSVLEEQRLRTLLSKVRTVEDAFRSLGAPDFDEPQGLGVQEPGGPTRWSRVLTYSGLSKTADVLLTVGENNELQVALQGKYIGSPAAGA